MFFKWRNFFEKLQSMKNYLQLLICERILKNKIHMLFNKNPSQIIHRDRRKNQGKRMFGS
jgi:hypothetical protein